MTGLFSPPAGSVNVDADIYTSVYEKCYPRLTALANVLIDNGHDAKDIVADAMVKLMCISEKFTGWRNIEAFLWIAVRNSCFNYLRHKKVEKNYKRAYLSLSREGYDTDEQDPQMERLTLVYELIDKLPCRCRQVFIMAYLDGWTRYAIANHLGITTDAVNSHLRNARNKIKGLIIKNIPAHAQRSSDHTPVSIP